MRPPKRLNDRELVATFEQASWEVDRWQEEVSELESEMLRRGMNIPRQREVF